MKRFTVLILTVAILSFLSCSYVTRPAVEAKEITWEEVESGFHKLDTLNDLKKSEEFAREMLTKTWADWQIEFIKYKLAKSLFAQGEFEKSLNVFNHLKNTKPNGNDIHLTAGAAALNLKKYEDSLRWVLTVYLNLDKSEKIPASKTVFLSYLYSTRIEKAAVWYSKLDETKKTNVKKELEEWFTKDPANRTEFEKYINQSPSEPPDSGIIKETPPSETAPAAFDGSYTPDWNQLCVMLFTDDKWVKYNDVITSFINWYFTDYRKSGININIFNYSDDTELNAAFDKASKLKCFAVAGPFFAPEFTDIFAAKSVEKSIPVFSYTPDFSENSGLLFNFHTTKDIEADNLIKYAISAKEKKTFAIAYLDNDEGRELRDLYWKIIEENGGKVTELIDLSPADNAFFDDIGKIVRLPGNYYEALSNFKAVNRSKYSNDTLMKRALEKFTKGVPGRCDFDTLVVLTPVAQMPLFIPSFPYKNVEFEYHSNFLNKSVQNREQELKDNGFEWNVQQILVLAPSELVNSDKVIEQLGTLVDGMTVFAPANNYTETNKYYSEMAAKFSEKNSRALYFAENIVSEITDIIFQAREKSGKKEIAGFVSVLKETPFMSTATGTELKFDSNNKLTGKSEIEIGRNKDSFISAPKPEKQKESDKKEPESKEKPAE
ncbi:MAG TPA: hypothetical protein PKG52_03025 [bacterium]|nr:hypothetical protein [bacterium]HPS29992.1 hypothetical protein [bacterium]